MRIHHIIFAVGILLANISQIWADDIRSQNSEIVDCNLCELEVTNDNGKEQLIAIYQVNFIKQDKTNKIIDNFLTHSYDRILMSIYLSHVLNFDEFPENTLQRIEQFIDNEKENSLPYFLLSYYYFKKQEYAKSVDNLEKANICPTFEDYTGQRKIITKIYLEKLQLNEQCILNESMFTLTNFPFLLVKMSRDDILRKDIYFKNALLLFSHIFEKIAKI